MAKATYKDLSLNNAIKDIFGFDRVNSISNDICVSCKKEAKEFKELESQHKRILESYFKQNWQEALGQMSQTKSLCKNLMNDYYDMMSERITEFKKNPPPPDWDGVFIATSK